MEDKKNIPLTPAPAQDEGNENITLVVQDQAGGELSFKIKRKTPFRKLMSEYCKRNNLDINVVRFR